MVFNVLLTATIGLREGMAIILLPSILTNIRQGLLGESPTLAIDMQKNALLTKELFVLFALAFIPSYIGMSIGERNRKKISEELSRRLFFIFMLILGLVYYHCSRVFLFCSCFEFTLFLEN